MLSILNGILCSYIFYYFTSILITFYMGAKKSKMFILKSHELDEFSKITAFKPEEINNLYTHFKAFSSLRVDDGVIDYDEWCAALGAEKCKLVQNIFTMLDENSDQVINFREFLLGISMLVAENQDTKIKLSYRIFDPDQTGITDERVLELIYSALEIMNNIEIPKDIVKAVVQKSFESLLKGPDGKGTKTSLDFNDYKRMIKDNPQILQWINLDLEKLKYSAKLLIGNPKKYSKAPLTTKTK